MICDVCGGKLSYMLNAGYVTHKSCEVKAYREYPILKLQIEALQQENEQLQAQAAQMREALKQAVADMKLIAGDVISEKNCYICEYYVDGQGCMLDGTQFNDDGECHFTWHGANSIDKVVGE